MRSVTAVVLLAMLVLTGCGSKKEEPPPWSPTPRPSTATPTPFSPTKSDEELYPEAEKVLRRTFAIEKEYLVHSALGDYPAELNELLLDPYLSLSKETYAFYREQNWHMRPDSEVALTVVYQRNHMVSGADTALRACVDTRNSPAVDIDGTVVSEGVIREAVYYFKLDGDKLKLFQADSYGEVPACTLGA